MNRQLNEQQIVQKWSPMIESVTGVKNKSKLSWISKYAHFHALNESAVGMGGVTSPYSTLYNVPGVGSPQPGSMSATSGTQQSNLASRGSGDKWPALLPMALQVAARTIGFDLVNVVPMPGPTGVISYLDYVYAGGKQPFGAPPANSPQTANPAGKFGDFEAPLSFKLQIDSSVARLLTTGQTVTFGSGTNTLEAVYIGKARIDGFSLFRRKSELPNGGFGAAAMNLSNVFPTTEIRVERDASTIGVTLGFPSLISTLENQIQGFVGSGTDDNDPWEGTFVSGTTLYEPMERGVGEAIAPRALGLQVFTKFVDVGTFQVSVNVTLEQIQDLNKQWGIDVIAMVENAGINEISQSINKHILSRLFAHGWLNHIRAELVEGINVNLNLNSSTTASESPAFAYNENGVVKNTSMTCPPAAIVPTSALTAFENQDTMIKRIMSHILLGGNLVMQRGRRGPANFIVTNLKLATALQSNAGYTFSPITNTFTQSNGSLYPLGTIAGMTLYVDPNMLHTDTRVLIGRKGATDEPGVIFAPYLMAESVKLITEGTAAPKVIIKSRYALVDSGFHTETQYLTIFIDTTSGAII